MLNVTQIATSVYLQNKVCERTTNKGEEKKNNLRKTLVSFSQPLEYMSTLASMSPCRTQGWLWKVILQTAGLVSSVVMASYRANGYTHPHENQQRDMWCMYIFNFVCSRVFCGGVSLCFKNQSLLKRIRLKNWFNECGLMSCGHM